MEVTEDVTYPIFYFQFILLSCSMDIILGSMKALKSLPFSLIESFLIRLLLSYFWSESNKRSNILLSKVVRE